MVSNLKYHLGFTIIEVVITIVIISILAVAVFYNLPIQNINLPAQAAKLADDIRLTQTLSMTNAQRYRLVRLSSTTYQIRNAAGTAVVYPGTGSTVISLGRGITFGTFTNLPSNLIVFDSNGTPYTNTATPGNPLNAIATIPIIGEGSTKTIQIMPQTGWVKVL